MATITALNVRLGMDASNFAEGANLARAEVNKVSSILRQSEAPASKYKKELDLLNRSMSDAGKQTKQYADAVEFLKRKHGQMPPEINKAKTSVDDLKHSMLNAVPSGHMLANALKSPMGVALALAAALAVVSREVSKAAERIDETAKAAKGLGVAYRDLIALQMLASESGGIDASTLNRGMGMFVRKIAEARVNGGALAETMNALGLDVGKLAGMNPAEAFAQVADVIQGIHDHAERVRVAVALFGREGVKFVEVLAKGSAGLAATQRESERLGTAISDEATAAVEAMNDAWGRAGSAVQGIWNTITTSLAPILTSVAKLAEDFFVAVRKALEVYVEFYPVVQAVGFLVGKMIDDFRKVIAFVSDTVDLLASIPGMLSGGELNTSFSETHRLLDEMKANANGTAAAARLAAEQAEALAIELQRAADEAAKIEEQYRKRVDQLAMEYMALTGNVELSREMKLLSEGYTLQQARSLIELENINEELAKKNELEKKAAAEAEALERKFGNRLDQLAIESVALSDNAELAREMKLAAEGYSRAQIETIAAMEKQNALLRSRKEAEKEALAAAKKYFEEQRKIDEKRRADIARGPGAGMEEGSQAAAKFMADQVNAAIGTAVVPEKPTPGEKEIVAKARELLIAQQAANDMQRQELEAQKQLLIEFRENRFTRFR